MRKEKCRNRERIATLEGRESVLADMLKVNQDELSDIKDQMHKLTGIITVNFTRSRCAAFSIICFPIPFFKGY